MPGAQKESNETAISFDSQEINNLAVGSQYTNWEVGK